MTSPMLTDLAIRAALSPSALAAAPVAEIQAGIADEIRRTGQRKVLRLPWRPSAAATLAEQRRAHWLRLAFVAAALATALAVVAAGAQLMQPRSAPPQYLLARLGALLSAPAEGGTPRGVPALAGRFVEDFNPSPDGRWIATISRPRDAIEIWEAAEILNGRSPRPIVIERPRGVTIRDLGLWMPDSSALILPASASGAMRLFRVDTASGGLERVSPNGLHVVDWVASPDGTRLAVLGQRDGSYGIFVIGLASGEVRQVAADMDGYVPWFGGLGWSPDSARIAYTAADIGSTVTLIVDADGGTPVRLTGPDVGAAWPVWSPLGDWIALEVGRGTTPDMCRSQVAVIRPDGTDLRILVDWAVLRSWSEDGAGTSVSAETNAALPGAPLGGLVTAGLDGSIEVKLPHTEADVIGAAPANACWPYGFLASYYRGRR